MTSLKMDERELMKKVTMTVTVKKSWRVWFGLRLIRMGAKLANIGYKEIEP
jgi:IS4 transposase